VLKLYSVRQFEPFGPLGPLVKSVSYVFSMLLTRSTPTRFRQNYMRVALERDFCIAVTHDARCDENGNTGFQQL
jgi:hypothetical protein